MSIHEGTPTAPTRRRRLNPVALLLAFVLAAGAMFGIVYSRSDSPKGNAAVGQSATPAPVLAPASKDMPYGCDVRPDGTYDKNDPLCGTSISDEERFKLKDFRVYYRDEPAFNCADRRNFGLDINDQDKFSPCPNGSLHVVIERGTLRLVNVTGAARIENNIDLWNANATPEPKTGWVVRLGIPHTSTATHDNGTTTTAAYRRVNYQYSANIKPFMAFERENGGQWTVSLNTNDHAFYDDATYDIVFTWSDANSVNTPAPLPFDWKCLPNNYYGVPRC